MSTTTRDNTKQILRLHTDLARVMADERFDDGRHKGYELRSFIVAYRWARFEGGDHETIWARTKVLAGLTAHGDNLTGHRLKELYRADAPRYEPASMTDWRQHRCTVPMMRGPRTGEPCGKRPDLTGRITDPDTGEWEIRGWCSRHRDIGERVLRYERTVPKREPYPNVGGLLPCYIRASNWPDIYAAASYGWKPPSVGIEADDWPVMRRVVANAVLQPKFTALDGGGETTGTDAEIPALRLVTS